MNEIMNTINLPMDFDSLPAESKKIFQGLQMQVQTLEMCRQLGSHYSQTAMVPKQYQGKPEDAAVAIQWGMEIGLQPLQSLQNIAVINGSPALWGDAMIAIIKGSGQCEYIHSEFDDDSMTAIVSTKRKGEPSESRSFSMADAKAAGLLRRQTYQQHPKRMLNARARSHVLRDVYADLLRGFQVREIVEEDNIPEKDITPKSEVLKSLLSKHEQKPEPKPESVIESVIESVVEPELQQSNPDGVREMIELIQSSSTLDDLNALTPEIIQNSRLSDADRDKLRPVFLEHKKAIESAADLGDLF